MARQTELCVLLGALTRAACSGDARTAHGVKQKVFLLFANLERTLEGIRELAADELRKTQRLQQEIKTLRAERDHAHQALERAIRNEQPQPRPFDIEAAKRGEPIEWQPLYAEHWEPGEFVGITSTGKVVVELAPLNVNIHPIEKLRMKASETEQVTAYVNAYRMANGNMFFGVRASEDAAKELAARAAGRNTVIAVAAPVKITVNK